MNYYIKFWCNWFDSLIPALSNSKEIIIGIIVGVLTGLIASIIFSWYSNHVKRKRLDKKYKPIEGTYIRWFKEDKQKGSNKIHAKAYLKHYHGENRLDIRVDTFMHNDGTSTGRILSDPQVWTGEIVMDTIRSDTVVWEQKIPTSGNNGFKRIIVGKNQDGITLVGEADKGFGVERFTDKETILS